jgi:hypothetical protein
LFWSLGYLALRCLFQLVLLRPRSEGFKELEIVVLRYELSLLRRQAPPQQLGPSDRLLLAAASRLLPRSRWGSFLVTPTTLPCAGTGGSLLAAGHTPVGPADRRSAARSASSSFALLGITRAGATSGLPASSTGSD